MTKTAKKQPKEKRSVYQVCVYPQASDRTVCGTGSFALNQAIGIAAHLIAEASGRMQFTPAEWKEIGQYGVDITAKSGGVEIPPASPSPGQTVATLLSRRGLTPALAKKIERLDYCSAWAVIIALQHLNRLKASNDEPTPATQWWSVKNRTVVD